MIAGHTSADIRGSSILRARIPLFAHGRRSTRLYEGEVTVRIESIPQAYIVHGGFAPPAAHAVIACARTVLAYAFALWPLTGTMLATGALLISL